MNILENAIMIWSTICDREFEIEASISSADLACCDDCEVEMDEDLFNMVKKEASSFLHNRWIDQQANEGWGYGTLYNEESMTDPRMRDWHSLHDAYKEEIDMDTADAAKFIAHNEHLFQF